MLIADTNEFHPLVNGPAYAAGHAPDGSPFTVVIIRATYSTTHVDNAYASSVATARAAGLLIGHYGYLAKSDDPGMAGQFFADTVAAHGGIHPGDTIWCDCEEGEPGIPEAPRIAAFLGSAHNTLHDDPADEGVYSGDAFYRANIGSKVQASGVTTKLWIADYGATPVDGQDLFQYTDAATVFPGVSGPCDGSIFNGTRDQFLALFTSTHATATPASSGPPSTAASAAPAPYSVGGNVIAVPFSVTTDAAGWAAIGIALPNGKNKDAVVGVVMDDASGFDPGHTWYAATGGVDYSVTTAGHATIVVHGDPGHFFTGRAYVAS